MVRNTLAIVSLTALAVFTPAFASIVPPCNKETLQVIPKGPATIKCGLEAGYAFLNPTAPVTSRDLEKICKSEACKYVFLTAIKTNPSECLIPLTTIRFREDIVEKIVDSCWSQPTQIPTPTMPPATPRTTKPTSDSPVTQIPGTGKPTPGPTKPMTQFSPGPRHKDCRAD